MKELTKFNLRFKESMEYFQDCLSDVNELSRTILKSIDFRTGSFFTLFPKNTDKKKLHDFKLGGVLPQNPVETFSILKRQIKGQIIPTIKEEISRLVCTKISSCDSLSCIIDDYNSTLEKIKDDELFINYGYSNHNEIYYCFNKTNKSIQWITKSLQRSNTFWHSLGILTEVILDSSLDKKLSPAKIHEICLNANLIFVGAYDGEGYVFWEKNEK